MRRRIRVTLQVLGINVGGRDERAKDGEVRGKTQVHIWRVLSCIFHIDVQILVD